MPQGPVELHEKWGSDVNALAHLKPNFALSKGGVLYRRKGNYVPTVEDESAIDYLFLEWDYGYDAQRSMAPR